MDWARFQQAKRCGAGRAIAGLLCAAIAIAVLSCGDDNGPTGSSEPMTVTDIDGNVYQTVRIGAKVWMVENLRVKHYRNGDPIPLLANYWGFNTTSAYCCYNNDTAIASEYGLFYNWYAVNDSRGLAPEGWHVASDSEWMALELRLRMSASAIDSTGWRGNDEGQALKESGTEHWPDPNPGTNQWGFTALPGGRRDGTSGYFYALGIYTWLWSSTSSDNDYAVCRGLRYSDGTIYRSLRAPKSEGYSVRCVRD